MGLFSGVLKIVPLFIFVRSAGCKINSLFCEPSADFACARANPYLDEYLSCWMNNDNNKTANTAEQVDWAAIAWAPHYTELLKRFTGVEFAVPAPELLVGIGALELVSWLLLWTPLARLGALGLFATMVGAIEMHVVVQGDPLEKLGLQISLLFAAGYLAFLAPAEPAAPAKRKRE